MYVKKQLIFFFLPVTIFLMMPLSANGSDLDGNSGEDVPSTTDLAAIEQQQVKQSSPQSVEDLDEDARAWFTKFQEGGVLFDGWKAISADLVQQVPEEQKLKTKDTMDALGVKIGCEWSKENDVRKISTKMLKKWGKQLRATVAGTPVKIPVVLSTIESEVDSLLL
ncbi:MAG: hypothetical protein ABFR63_04615 [Thermodesulfobacteriota bacterium]